MTFEATGMIFGCPLVGWAFYEFITHLKKEDYGWASAWFAILFLEMVFAAYNTIACLIA